MALTPTQYDEKIIREAANQLYRKASNTLALYILGGMLLTPFAATLIFKTTEAAGIGLFLGILAGTIIGTEKAFKYKLDAQLALCQLQIEINTRP